MTKIIDKVGQTYGAYAVWQMHVYLYCIKMTWEVFKKVYAECFPKPLLIRNWSAINQVIWLKLNMIRMIRPHTTPIPLQGLKPMTFFLVYTTWRYNKLLHIYVWYPTYIWPELTIERLLSYPNKIDRQTTFLFLN